VVSLRTQHAIRVGLVADERDWAVVAAKRCTRQGKAAGGVTESFPDGVPPGLGVAAVVDLAEDHQRLARFGTLSVQRGMRSDLGV
ncbi:hypothetical protein OVV29_37360, partial [Klebsiella pneumoniae]|nr:hypothetical protein [Klebsiella pneumoniae]